ncbi:MULTISPECIES: LpxL/LpxP family acyltransferase, partial [Enterobacteriaceae]
DDAETTAAWMNKVVEKCIMMAPEQYMWLHRRFKTRPEGVPSRY